MVNFIRWATIACAIFLAGSTPQADAGRTADAVTTIAALRLRISLPTVPASTLCMALAVYHESRGEPERGQRAVAAVVMNRSLAGRQDACKTVFAPMQFSWTARPVEWIAAVQPEQFDASLAVARSVVRDGTDGFRADHFYSGAAPVWAKRAVWRQQIGHHTFLALR